MTEGASSCPVPAELRLVHRATRVKMILSFLEICVSKFYLKLVNGNYCHGNVL